MRRVALLAVAFLLFATVAAEAGRDDDFEFAQGLVEWKFYDLAKEEFQKIIDDSGRTAEARANGELGLALLLKAQANDAKSDSKKTPADILALYDEAESRFDKFLSEYPNHPNRDQAKFEVGNLLWGKGDYLTKRMVKEPDKAAEYRKIAETGFDAAIDLFKQVSEQLEEEVDRLLEDLDENDPLVTQTEWSMKRAQFYFVVSYYYKGLIYPEESEERRGVLSKALGVIDEFVWDNEDNILGGYAYLYYALAKKDLDDPDGALELFKTVTGYPVPEPDKDPHKYKIWTELILQAYKELGAFCNKIGMRGDRDFRDIAKLEFDEMQVKIPNVLDRKFGHFALLEYARVLMGLGKTGEALRVATEVSQKGEELAEVTEWGAATAFLANRLLNDIIAGGADITLPPDVLLKAALGKLTSRQWGQAVRAFQQVVAASKTEEEQKEFASVAWMKIGLSYYMQDKFLEAYYSYQYVMNSFPGLEDEEGENLGGSAAYWRYRSATALHTATKAPEDEVLKKDARSEFATKFKEHPRSIDLQYYEGADYITDGDAKRIEGKPKEAEEFYDLALQRLGNTKKSSVLYTKALARIGEVLYKLGKEQEGLDALAEVDKFVNDSDNVTTDPNRKANRSQSQAIAAYYSSLCLAKQKKWKRVLEILDGYEAKFSDERVRDFHPHVKFERVRALIETKDLANAEKQAAALRKDFPDSGRSPQSYHLLGLAHHKAAKLVKDSDPAAWKEHMAKAAEEFSYYLDHKANPTADDFQTIGIWYRQLDNWPKAEQFLEKALIMYQGQYDALAAKSPKRKGLEARMEGLSVMMSELLLKQGDYQKAADFFEGLLVPDKGAMKRVKELLLMQEHNRTSLRELQEKIRAVPSFMEGLALAYKELGKREDLLRALTLLNFLSSADKKNMYTPKWWGWRYLIFQIYLDYGMSFSDKRALNNLIAMYERFKSLGVLENCPHKNEMFKLYQKAKTEAGK